MDQYGFAIMNRVAANQPKRKLLYTVIVTLEGPKVTFYTAACFATELHAVASLS